MSKKVYRIQKLWEGKKITMYDLCRFLMFMLCESKRSLSKFKWVLYKKDHVACTLGYKLVCVDDKLMKSFKAHLVEDAVYNFINSMI